MAGRSKKFNKRSAVFIIAVIAILAIAAVIVYFVAPDIFGKPAPSPGGEGTIETPGDDTETPGGDTETPGGDTETPGGDTETPGDDTETPGDDTETPGDDTETPGGDTETPGGDTETPGGDTETPGGDTETPGDDTETPGDDGPPLVAGEGELQVHFMNVGQGDSILILFPDGKDMLIDCANYNNASSYRTKILANIDNYVTDGQLDYLMLTHCDSDHVYFMDEVLEKYDVDTVFMPNVLAVPSGTQSSDILQAEIDALDQSKVGMFTDEDTVDSNAYAEFFIAALSEPDCEVILTVDPDEDTNSIVITDGTKQADGSYAGATYMLTFYCPTEEYYEETGFNAANGFSEAEYKNAISPIGILEYNGVRVVLTGDSNEINEPLFVERAGYMDCDVLKVGHHGSETSSTEEFLDAVDCEYAIISCNAEGNSFYHPRQNTLDRLIEDGMTIYRTDNNGNILLTVDENGEITFTTEREADQAVNGDGWTDEEINEAKKK